MLEAWYHIARMTFAVAGLLVVASKAIPLDGSILADFSWRLKFCECFNCRACILRDLHPIPMYTCTDSLFMGFGAWVVCDWCTACWSGEYLPTDFTFGCSHQCDSPIFDSAPKNINMLELWPVVMHPPLGPLF